MKYVLVVLALALLADPALAAKKTAKTSHHKAAGCCDQVDAAAPKPCYRHQHTSIHHRCEPQSLPYGRCRTGIMRCRGNHELSPIGWFTCEKLHGKTSDRPADGTILILGDNVRHRMATGHVFVVEHVRETRPGHWELTLSHTNHDRKCSLETNVLGDYDQHAKVLAMKTGAWSKWGKHLIALGFIEK